MKISDARRLITACLHSMFIQAQKEKRGVIFKRAESYVKEYRDAEREKIRLTRLSKQEGTYYVPGEAKLVFVVRIKGFVCLCALSSFGRQLTRIQYQQNRPQASQNSPTSSSPSDQQCHLCQAHQSHRGNVEDCRTLHRIWISLSQDRPRSNLQARIRQSQQATYSSDRQQHH